MASPAAAIGTTRKTDHETNWLGAWEFEFERVLRDKEHRLARRALDWLVGLGCDRKRITHLVAAATHPDADKMNPIALQIKNYSRQLFTRLNSVKTRVSNTQKAFQDLLATPYAKHFVALDSSVFRVDFPIVLETVSGYINDPMLGISRLRRIFDGRKIPSGLAVAALCGHIRLVTHRAAYAEISLLLSAGYLTHKSDRQQDSESLRQKIRGFKRDHGELFHVLAQLPGLPEANRPN